MIKQKCESQNEGNKTRKLAKLSVKINISYPLTRAYHGVRNVRTYKMNDSQLTLSIHLNLSKLPFYFCKHFSNSSSSGNLVYLSYVQCLTRSMSPQSYDYERDITFMNTHLQKLFTKINFRTDCGQNQ